MADQDKTHGAVTGDGSALQRYRRMFVGRGGFGALLYYEICVWMAVAPGALGLWLRKQFWPRLFRHCGSGTVFGGNVVLRQPHRIILGDDVVVSDGVILDARNAAADTTIEIGDEVMLANDVMLSCKNGTLRIGARCGIGARTIVHAVAGCHVELGEDLIIGPACYIAGGGNYDIDRVDAPMAQQGLRDDDGVTLEGDNWLGAHVAVMPGVTMGRGSVAAAGAVVTESVGAMMICGGVPARELRRRGR